MIFSEFARIPGIAKGPGVRCEVHGFSGGVLRSGLGVKLRKSKQETRTHTQGTWDWVSRQVVVLHLPGHLEVPIGYVWPWWSGRCRFYIPQKCCFKLCQLECIRVFQLKTLIKHWHLHGYRALVALRCIHTRCCDTRLRSRHFDVSNFATKD